MSQQNPNGAGGAVLGGCFGLFLVFWSMVAIGGGHGTGALIPFAVSPVFLPWPGAVFASLFWSVLGYLAASKPSRDRSMAIAVLVTTHVIGAIAYGDRIGGDFGSLVYGLKIHPLLTGSFLAMYILAMGCILTVMVRGFGGRISGSAEDTEEEPPYIRWARGELTLDDDGEGRSYDESHP